MNTRRVSWLNCENSVYEGVFLKWGFQEEGKVNGLVRSRLWPIQIVGGGLGRDAHPRPV